MFILNENREPVSVTPEEWGRWFETADRHVDYDEISASTGETVTVSTVFLGIDHNFGGEGRPLLFETMIFGGKHDQDYWRYATWAEAKIGHKKAVEVASES